jgi:hypothetical protein
VAIAVAVRSARKGGAPPSTPPLTQGAGTAPPGQVGAATYGAAPYGASPYGSGQQNYAGYAPTGYASPPANPYGQPYGQPYGSQPQYGNPAQPPAQEPPAGTAPCPGCGAPVAYYAPSCASCGHPLDWS